jgi:sialic acid synthase SpsE/mannose-6-phosphate isomerase-like protein (cupin superfamily)
MRDKRPLFIYEMANNHMGDVEHGIRIIQELKSVSEGFPFTFAVKLQYRDIETCIHPDYKNRMDMKYVKRFTETALSWDQYKTLKDAIVDAGFLSICTPWDEVSVDKIVEHGYDFIKVPSCYLTDWPLLERIAKYNLPVIASVAGQPLSEIDKVVSFFTHRRKQLSLLHCVAEYPTSGENLNLGQITLLKNRYPNIEIGYSTHESPNSYDSIGIAIALGATVFEKHVALNTEKYKANDYSATPDQVFAWLNSAEWAFNMIGVDNERYASTEEEQQALQDLQRGAFADKQIGKGEFVKHVFFAMPAMEGQMTAQDFSKYSEITALEGIRFLAPIMKVGVKITNKREQVYNIVQEVKAFIKKSKVPVPGQCELEISHHCGIENFHTTGITAITVVNRGYCKRLMVVLPGQKHPEQWHEKKDETYHVLYGDVTVSIGGVHTFHKANDIITILHGLKHSFWTSHGAVIEEISSSYESGDSWYTDESIMKNLNRKTYVSHWME